MSEMSKPEIVRAWCAQRVGCPYVYGATGKPCTPSYRAARMSQYPAYAEKIKRNCPRLSGKSSSCAGCKWCDPETGVGKLAYDCAQLSRWAMDAVGISLVSGANSQWERTAWAEFGTIDTLPRERVCLVFRRDEDHMGHVGVYQGDGAVIHAKGHDYGVVRQKLEDAKFTHWGIPCGLYEEVEPVVYPALRRGDSGEDVRQMQKLLILLNYLPTDGDDGKFGSKTEAAVRAFQRDMGLVDDGVCGPLTWGALIRETSHDDSGSGDDTIATPDDGIESPDPDVVIIPRSDWNAIRAAVAVLSQAVKKYESVG